jgi:phosphohistidine swiveling domain-containing protein
LVKRAELRFKKWQMSTAAVPLKEELERTNKSRLFHGIGASAGEIQGRASVVRSLEEAQNILPGTILVAGSIDPAWTPIFSKVSGLILEVGGILSHAAIVAREFRLPAVTSVAQATAHISDGQIVHIDGMKGTVRII